MDPYYCRDSYPSCDDTDMPRRIIFLRNEADDIVEIDERRIGKGHSPGNQDTSRRNILEWIPGGPVFHDKSPSLCESFDSCSPFFHRKTIFVCCPEDW